MRRTLAQAKNSRIPIALNILPTDSRFLSWMNAATERLLPRGHWVGTTPKYRVSVTEQLMAMPPYFATIEQVGVCQTPVRLRNEWYEFHESGFGILNDPTADATSSGTSQGVFRGRYPTFKDIVSGHAARVQCDVAADVGDTILILGYDSSGNWVRTQQAGVWADGEVVTLAQSPGTLTTTLWSQITGIQKDVTNGQLWVYDWDGSTNTVIANIQYWEENPDYARYLLPTIPGTSTQINLIGKLAYRPLVNDSDFLIIPNLEAMRLGCMAVKLEEEPNPENLQRAALLMNGRRDPRTGVAVIEGAITILEDELAHYHGAGTVAAPKFQYGSTDEPVETLV